MSVNISCLGHDVSAYMALGDSLQHGSHDCSMILSFTDLRCSSYSWHGGKHNIGLPQGMSARSRFLHHPILGWAFLSACEI